MYIPPCFCAAHFPQNVSLPHTVPDSRALRALGLVARGKPPRESTEKWPVGIIEITWEVWALWNSTILHVQQTPQLWDTSRRYALGWVKCKQSKSSLRSQEAQNSAIKRQSSADIGAVVPYSIAIRQAAAPADEAPEPRQSSTWQFTIVR